MARLVAEGIVSAIAATASLTSERTAYADGPFNFSPFSFSQPSPNPTPQPSSSSSSPPQSDPEKDESPPKPRNNNPRTMAMGFDPKPLERGSKLLELIDKAPNAKKVFELIAKQEETKQAEIAAKKAEYEAMKAQNETQRQQIVYEEQKKLNQQLAETKAKLAQYEDELARKRLQADNELQRARNQELVEMQEKSSMRQEQARRKTEEEIQAARRQTEKEKAENECETIRVRAFAEAEGIAHEAKLAEDVNKRMLIERVSAEREKWVAAINTTFEHIGGGVKAIITYQNKLVVAVGGVTALAAGIYTTSRSGHMMIVADFPCGGSGMAFQRRCKGYMGLCRQNIGTTITYKGVLDREIPLVRHIF